MDRFKAPRRVGCGEGVSPSLPGEGSVKGLDTSSENVLLFDLKCNILVLYLSWI